jgi:hypothetical protein
MINMEWMVLKVKQECKVEIYLSNFLEVEWEAIQKNKVLKKANLF